MKTIKFFAIIFFTMVFTRVQGQTCCSGGTPLTGNLGIQTIEPGSWYFNFSYDYNFLDALYSGTTLLDDDTRDRVTQSLLLQAIYPISEKFSINGLFTYVGQQRTVFSPLGNTEVTNAQGVGDMVVLAQYTLLSDVKRSITIAAGPKIPFGKFDATDPELGLVLNPDLQPGTGSWDGIIGASYNQYHFLKPNLTFSSYVSYRTTTKAKRFEGDNDYKFGNEFMVSAGLSNQFLIKRTAIGASAHIRYRNAVPDQISGLKVPGTGGNWFILIPGVYFEPNDTWTFSVSGEIPLYNNLNGTQLTTTYRLNAGIAIKLFRN